MLKIFNIIIFSILRGKKKNINLTYERVFQHLINS